MSIQHWALLISGLAVLYLGIGLMAYGVLQRRTEAGESNQNWIAQILEATAKLVEAFGKYLGPNQATRVGLLFAVVGLSLIFVPFYIPGLK
jgi:hypothetical protein